MWPVDCPAAAPFHWMMRMVMRTYSGEGRVADGEVLDELWHGLRLTAVWNKSETPAQCVEDHFDETVCFERLVVMGRQEDRDNTRAPEWENRRAFWVIRNITMRTMGIEQPPVHIAWNASLISQRERRKIREVLSRNAALNSTISTRLFTGSVKPVDRQASRRQRCGESGSRFASVVRDARRPVHHAAAASSSRAAVRSPRRRPSPVAERDDTFRVLSHIPSLSLTFLHSMHDCHCASRCCSSRSTTSS